MKPFAHQAREYERYWNSAYRALLWQPRTGKTKAAIDKACALYQACEIDGVLIIAPNGVHLNWTVRQIPEHHWNFPHVTYAWRSRDPYRITNAQQLAVAPDFAWFAVNMEVLIRGEALEAIKNFIRARRRFFIIFDESHHFAQPGAKRTGLARGLAKLARYRAILTGTNIENSPLQAYSQFELLEPGALGFKTYEPFKNYFAEFEPNWRGSRQYLTIKNYRNLEELKARLAKYSSVVLREECEDLPAIQSDVRIVEMSDEQAEAYRVFKEQDIEVLEEMGFQIPPEGGALLTKLQQIEGGYVKTPNGIKFIDDAAKFNVVVDEVSGYNTLIWCVYVHEIEAIAKKLEAQGIKTGIIHGQTKNRENVLQAFAKGRLQAIVAQPKSIGEGRDISSAEKILWYSQTPDAIVRTQASERATKTGTKKKQMIDIYSPHGVDAYFLNLTSNKIALADDVSRRGLQAILKDLDV